jgi:hypothetical protein
MLKLAPSYYVPRTQSCEEKGVGLELWRYRKIFLGGFFPRPAWTIAFSLDFLL